MPVSFRFLAAETVQRVCEVPTCACEEQSFGRVWRSTGWTACDTAWCSCLAMIRTLHAIGAVP